MQECIGFGEVKAMMAYFKFLCQSGFWILSTCTAVYAMTIGNTAELCEAAARDAADRYEVPQQILQTLMLTETGRSIEGSMRPWPWAINSNGESFWFDSKADMLEKIDELILSDVTNFDIGCFQLNYRWHAQNFSDVAEMADPNQNARYAASFLRSKFNESTSWQSAVGAYHSQTASKASVYLARFEGVFNQWIGQPQVDQTPASEPADYSGNAGNSFPLLIAGQVNSGPSLVPPMQARQRLIGSDN